MPTMREARSLYEPDEELERAYLDSVLASNKRLNFVKRVMAPDQYPVIANPDGSYSTHRMSWSDTDKGGGIVYPNIVQRDGGDLVELPPDDAHKYAIENGEYIPFDRPEDADWFSQNYKKVWSRGGR